MAKSTTYCNDLLKLALNGTAIANLANNASTSPATQLFLALHTADPGAGGSQNTSEVSYTGYARAAVDRTAAMFTVTGNKASFAAKVTFPKCTATANTTATHLSIGMAATGAGKVLYVKELSDPILVNLNTTPAVEAGSNITEA